MERFDASKATKLQFKSGDTELVLESTPAQNPYMQPAELPMTAQPVSTGAAKQEPEAIEGTPVKAPLVGTFYCAPSPEEKPFVSVGQTVKKGDVVGIIEAMKLMNEITAPEDGVVKSIFAENGNMVEYGEVLLVLE